MPDVASDLVFHVDKVAPSSLASEIDVRGGRLYFVGPLTRAARFATTGPSLSVGLRFKPWGASSFLRQRLSAFANATVEASAIWGRFGELWCQRLGEMRTLSEVVSDMARPLWQDQADGAASDRDVVRAAWTLLEAAAVAEERAPGLAAIGDSLGLGDRRLRRLFDRHVGLSPRTALSILRFHGLLRGLPEGGAGGPPAWAALAARCGYYDQAHMIKDFRRLTARSPTRLWG